MVVVVAPEPTNTQKKKCSVERRDLTWRVVVPKTDAEKSLSLCVSLSLSDAALPCSARPPVLKRSALSSTALLKAAPLEVCWYTKKKKKTPFLFRSGTRLRSK